MAMAKDVEGERDLARSLDPATRRSLGVYFTPEPVARLMASLVRHKIETGRDVIDPSAGSGRLLIAAIGQLDRAIDRARAAERVHGVERQSRLASFANRAIAGMTGVERPYCRVGDALTLVEGDARRELFGRDRFGAVIANPPYVREKNNRRVFAELCARVPAWKRWFRPRQDLQQLFLALGVLLLEEGGELAYLVNPYWLHSDSGQPVRELVSAQTSLLSVIDFGERRLFKDAPGQHHLLIHARRAAPDLPAPPTRFLRVTPAAGASVEAVCQRLQRVVTEGGPEPGIEVTESSAPLGRGPRRRWYWPGPEDQRLAALDSRGVPLGECFQTHQGVVSGADCVTRRNRAVLGSDVSLGAGIFVISDDEMSALGPSPRERQILRPLYRAREIAPFVVRGGDARIIYLTWQEDLSAYPAIAAHLERFRPLLAKRREARLGKMPWFALHWPRDPRLFERPRIVTPRRAVEPRFAMGRPGFCEQSDIAMITDPDDDERRLMALLVVLNSEIIATWSRYRGKHKGRVREFFGRALEEIPIPAAARDDPDAFALLARYAHEDRLEAGSRAVEALFHRGARASGRSG